MKLTRKKFLKGISLLLLSSIMLVTFSSCKDKKLNIKVDKAGIVSAHGRLKVNGTDLVDKNNEPYQLKGISTHGIQWYPQFISKESFKELRDNWGVNVIRLALYSSDTVNHTADSKEELEGYVDKGIRLCIELDMYVIVDWHVLAEYTPMTNKDSAMDFFNTFSKKYKDYPNVLYEICNEPNGNATWNGDVVPYANEVIPLIRKNAPKSVIIVGTPVWSQRLDDAANAPLKFDNIMYTLHFYSATHGRWLRQVLKRVREEGLPVFVTEFGLCESQGGGRYDFNEAEKWLTVLDEYKMSYIVWNLSNKDESSALLTKFAKPDGKWSDDLLSEAGKWIKNRYTSTN